MLSPAIQALINRILAEDKSLTEIDTTDGFITSNEIRAIADALITNGHVNKIYLLSIEIEHSTAMALCTLLKTNKTINSITLSNIEIDKDDLLAIIHSLQSNSSITHFELSHHQALLTDEINAIANLIKSNSVMTEINLFDCGLGDNGVKILSNALITNKTIKTMSLDENIISNKGCEHLSKLLASNHVITKISLGKNKIDCKGIEFLANVLRLKNNIEHLSLNNNQIGPSGAIAFASILESNKRIKEVLLDFNVIGDAGLNAIISKLDNGIEKLSIFSNNISDNGIKQLAHVLSINKTLKHLSLETFSFFEDSSYPLKNVISKEGVIALAEALESNRTLISLYLNLCTNTECITAFKKTFSKNTTLCMLFSFIDNDIILLSNRNKVLAAYSEACQTVCYSLGIYPVIDIPFAEKDTAKETLNGRRPLSENAYRHASLLPLARIAAERMMLQLTSDDMPHHISENAIRSVFRHCFNIPNFSIEQLEDKMLQTIANQYKRINVSYATARLFREPTSTAKTHVTPRPQQS